MNTTPVSLLERLHRPAAAAQDAWSRFVQLYTPLLFYWCQRAGLQEQDAADLVQEVFVVLLHKLPEFTYDQHKSFRGWLRTVTLNKWHDQCRRRGLPIQTGDQTDLDQLPGTNGLDAFWDAEYRQHLVGRALQIMRADFQPATWKACWEHIVNDRPAAEVAAELGVRVDSVYAATSRVLRRLRQELEGLID